VLSGAVALALLAVVVLIGWACAAVRDVPVQVFMGPALLATIGACVFSLRR
jgi:hypothetical protein